MWPWGWLFSWSAPCVAQVMEHIPYITPHLASVYSEWTLCRALSWDFALLSWYPGFRWPATLSMQILCSCEHHHCSLCYIYCTEMGKEASLCLDSSEATSMAVTYYLTRLRLLKQNQWRVGYKIDSSFYCWRPTVVTTASMRLCCKKSLPRSA